jgi:transcriptional regulator with XRE-family HTH domain
MKRHRKRHIDTDTQSPLSIQCFALTLARKVAELTQEELATRAGVSASFISLLEDGKRDIRLVGYETVTRIAWAFHVTPEELFPVLLAARQGARAATSGDEA